MQAFTPSKKEIGIEIRKAGSSNARRFKVMRINVKSIFANIRKIRKMSKMRKMRKMRKKWKQRNDILLSDSPQKTRRDLVVVRTPQ